MNQELVERAFLEPLQLKLNYKPRKDQIFPILFWTFFIYSFCKSIRQFRNLSVLITKRRSARRLLWVTAVGVQRPTVVAHSGKANRRFPRKAAGNDPCSRRGPQRLGFFSFFNFF
jgi:hypothetical protein